MKFNRGDKADLHDFSVTWFCKSWIWLENGFGPTQHWPPRCHTQLLLHPNHTGSFVRVPLYGVSLSAQADAFKYKGHMWSPYILQGILLGWPSPYSPEAMRMDHRPWRCVLFCSLTSIHRDCVIDYVAQQVGRDGYFISLIRCKSTKAYRLMRNPLFSQERESKTI